MEKIKNESQMKCILKGLAIAILFTIIALSLFSILLVSTNISEEAIEPVILVITGTSILIGSSIGTRKIKRNGLINGGCVGALYIFTIYLISSISISDFSLNWSSTIMIVVGIVGGVLGGIVGVNMGKNKVTRIKYLVNCSCNNYIKKFTQKC